MRRNLGRDLAVGALVLAAVSIFTVGLFFIGSEQRAWVRKVHYRIKVPAASGLQAGSPVRLAGVQVGQITDIHFAEDPNERGIEIELAVDKAHQHRIRNDTAAQIRILTLLAGEKYIELTQGDPALPVLEPGSYITVPESFGMEQLGELSAGLAGDIQSVSASIRIILETVLKREGVVGRMLLDPDFGKQAFTDITESAALIRGTLQDVKAGKGLAGRMLSDEQFARETTASLKSSLDRIEALLEKATAEGGTIDEMLDPNGKLSSAVDNVHRASADVREFAQDLKEGQGTLGRLISDERYASEVLGNIKKIAEDLAAITDKLNKGDGTLGAAINDPQLYQDLKDVVRGVQDSKVVGGLIKRYRKKGEEERLRRQKQEDETGDPNRPDGGD
ncbi:MAG TPA: MlaD family protein [Candidatus Polarisedimenticolia bacterium]|jgi:phospholipid/cholesterol/gamma-HCH transport system substrate-binding protein